MVNKSFNKQNYYLTQIPVLESIVIYDTIIRKRFVLFVCVL